MFNRHNGINRGVEKVPGGIRTTTGSNWPDLAARLYAHVARMYAHLDRSLHHVTRRETEMA
jgi:hypothetical protein